MDILDITSKLIIPIAAAIVGGIGVRLIDRWGVRQSQLQIIELATKRVAFWDAYTKVGMSVTESEPEERQKMQEDVRRALQRIRTEADQDFQRVSWFALVAQKRVPAAKLELSDKLAWWFLSISKWFFVLAFFVMLVQFGTVSVLRRQDLGFSNSFAFTVIVATFLALAIACGLGADRIKYATPKAAIDRI